MLNFKRTTAEDENFQKLVVLLDQDLAIRDGEDHDFYAQFDKVDKINTVIVCYKNEDAIGCGAFKKFNSDTVEIKRMFVHPNFRGKGIASTILAALENWASESGYMNCVLETGKNNPGAIALYQKSGYEIIPNYAQYENIKTSVCLKKQLAIH